jgi:two-component system sensor histidine kinase/response regulator
MIVDDNPANLKLLEDMLLEQGHEVQSFPIGRLALAAAEKYPPDLILLDVNMPEMNGYEVCEHLKSVQALSDIPVIFLSALNETQDKVQGFRSGAVDYISKPFQFEEVHARVKTHLRLHDLQQALKLQNERLEEAVAARTRELAEANRRLTILDRSKSDFLKLISHEFRTPLNGLLGAGELILGEMPSTEANNKLRGLFQRSRKRIMSMLNDAMLLTEIDVRAEGFSSAAVSLSKVLGSAIGSAAELAAARHVTLPPGSAEAGLVVGDEVLLARAFHALMETAVKFSEKDETVGLWCDGAADLVQVTIESRGRTVPCTALENFFDLFSIAEAMTPGGDLGVGPAMAQRILSLFGGSGTVANRDPSGIRLSVVLRRAAPHGGDLVTPKV